jgi:SH3 domain-containing YSC84-like protein 1
VKVLKIFVAALLLAALSAQAAFAARDRKEEAERARKAAMAFKEIMGAPDNAIPQELLDRANCVAVFPSVKKGGFVVGGQYGKGLISCRRGGAWTAPAYFTIGGGSFGLQIGAQAVDLVLLIMNSDGVDGLLKDKFEIGAGASAAAGPVGRNASASTDVLLKAQILSYSRSRGLFAGLELKGSVITQDKDANRDVYGREIEAREILTGGKVTSPATVRLYPQTLAQYTAKKATRRAKG